MKTISFFLLLVLITGATFAADLSGSIHDEKGQPISGATVKIYTAGMRTGSSPYCPSCWADCAKRVKTGPDGSFVIKNVNDDLVFRLLVLAQGYEPAFISKVDPKIGPAQGQLKTRDITAFHDKQVISGTVLDPDRKPVAGATVEPEINQKGLDPLTVTDESGNFVLTCPEEIRINYLSIKAEGYVPVRLSGISGGEHALKVNLIHGVTISGRVTDQGKPVPGIEIGTVQTDRSIEHWLGPQVAMTDESGTFHFYAEPPQMELAIYGLMNSLSSKGGIPVQIIHTGVDESILKAGNLAVAPAASIKGQLHETDGKPFPPKTRISVSRNVAWDLQIVDVNPDGSFEAKGIPLGEKIDISVPRDHQIQKVSPGFEIDPLNSRVLGTLSQSLSDFAIDLIYKDQKEQQAEQETKRITDNYATFFMQEKFTPEQIQLFITDKKAEYQAMRQDQQGTGVFEKLITDGFSVATYQDYLKFEDHRNGLIVISWFYLPPHNGWLTNDEKDKLAEVLGRVDRENNAQRTKDPRKLSKEEQLALSNQYIDRIEAAGIKVLPDAKHADYAQAMSDMRKMMEQIVANNAH